MLTAFAKFFLSQKVACREGHSCRKRRGKHAWKHAWTPPARPSRRRTQALAANKTTARGGVGMRGAHQCKSRFLVSFQAGLRRRDSRARRALRSLRSAVRRSRLARGFASPHRVCAARRGLGRAPHRGGPLDSVSQQSRAERARLRAPRGPKEVRPRPREGASASFLRGEGRERSRTSARGCSGELRRQPCASAVIGVREHQRPCGCAAFAPGGWR